MATVLIIGGGIVGLSVARAAIHSGHGVTLLEQGELPNVNGASHDAHRMIRFPYGAAEGYTRMVADAFPAWDRLWQDLGVAHFEDSNSLTISLADGDYAAQSAATLQRLGYPHEIIDRAAVERLCPHLAVPKGAWGLVSSPGGPLFAARIVEDMVRWLDAHGARLVPRSQVVTIDETAGLVTCSDGRSFSGDHIVVAAGAWLSTLRPEWLVPQSIYRQALLYVEPPAHRVASWRDAPAIVAIGNHSIYTLPDRRGAGLKFGFGGHRRLGMPADAGFTTDLEQEGANILAAFRPFLADEDYRPLRMKAAYYVMDSTRQFRLERHGCALLVTNCDGQMFKFGPLLGERIVAAIDGRLGLADLARWAAGH